MPRETRQEREQRQEVEITMARQHLAAVQKARGGLYKPQDEAAEELTRRQVALRVVGQTEAEREAQELRERQAREAKTAQDRKAWPFVGRPEDAEVPR